MTKILVYGFKEDRLWFGRPTLRSWVRCFFQNGGMLVVKPVKDWEQFAYYPDELHINFQFANLVSEWLDASPLASIVMAEKDKGNEITAIRPWTEK